MSGQLSDSTDCVLWSSPLTGSVLPLQVVSKVVFEMSGGAEVLEKTPEAGVPLQLSFNRPFFFAVVEGQSNAILLLGKITNPAL